MEGRPFETEAFLSSAQSSEVLGGLRDNIVPESHDDSTGGGTTNADIKENLHGVERELERDGTRLVGAMGIQRKLEGGHVC